MAINLKNARVEELLRELCRLTGESVTDAVGNSVAARLKSLGNRTSSMNLKEALLALGHEVSSLPDLDKRTSDELLGYSDEGTL